MSELTPEQVLQTVPLFNPKTNPCHGMVSAVCPIGCPDGYMPLLQGFRIGTGSIKARGSIYEIDQSDTGGLRTAANLGGEAASTGGGTVSLGPALYVAPGDDTAGIGSTEGIFRGSVYWKGSFYSAYVTESDPNIISIFKSSDLSTWTNVTPSTGLKQGTSGGYAPVAGQMATADILDSDSNIHNGFAYTEVSAPFSRDADGKMTGGAPLLVSSNGRYKSETGDGEDVSNSLSNAPIVFWKGGTVGVHKPVPAPAKVDAIPSVVGFKTWVNIETGMAATYYDYTTDAESTTQLLFSHSYSVSSSAGIPRWIRINISPENPGSTGLTIAGYSTRLEFNSFGSQTYSDGAGSAPAKLDLSDSKQLVVVYDDTEYPGFWDCVTLELIDSSGNRAKIWDPSDSAFSRQDIAFDGLKREARSITNVHGTYTYGGSNRYRTMSAFPTSSIVITKTVSGAFSLANVVSIKLKWINESNYPIYGVDDTAYVHVYMIAGSGNWAGGAQHAVSHLNYDGQAESPATVIPVGGGARICDMGGPADETTKVPDSAAFYYNVRLPISTPTKAVRDCGVCTAIVYRQEYGGTEFYGIGGTAGYQDFASWSSGDSQYKWSAGYYDSGSGTNLTASGEYTKYISMGYDGINYSRTMPSGLSCNMPPHTASASDNGRIFLADGNRVWMSEIGNGFRYREIPKIVNGQVDNYSGTAKDFQGEEVIAIAAVSASLYGSNQVLVWTNKTMRSLDSADPTMGSSTIGPMGIVGPRAIALHKGSVWVVDDSRQVRLYNNGGVGDPSKSIAEDWLASPKTAYDGTIRGVPPAFLPNIAMAWHEDRLYAAMSSGLYYNDTVLIYDTRTQGWTVDRELPAEFDAAQFIVFTDSAEGRNRLIAFGRYGRVFEYDKPDELKDYVSPAENSNAQAYEHATVALHTPEYIADGIRPITGARIGIASSASPGCSIWVKRHVKGGDDSAFTTLNLSSPSIVWRHSDNDPGGAALGATVQWRIKADVECGWEIFSIAHEMQVQPVSGAS